MSRKLLVTGHRGFVGRSMAAYLAASHGPDQVDWVASGIDQDTDIRNAGALAEQIAAIRPDAVLHLAAQSSVAGSFRDPHTTYAINFNGTLNLLQALRDCGFRGRLLYVSSGDVYGAVPEEKLPVSEALIPEPRNPYAVSKLSAELLCGQWARTEGIDTVVARPFNHIGPGQDRRFATSDFAAQLVAIAKGGAPAVLTTGNIDATRDFLDVRDVIRAYLALLEHGRSGTIYNVASGIERSLRSLVEHMAQLLGVEVQLQVDPARVRPNEQLRMAGDAGLLRAHTGWQPREAIAGTLERLIDFWKGELN